MGFHEDPISSRYKAAAVSPILFKSDHAGFCRLRTCNLLVEIARVDFRSIGGGKQGADRHSRGRAGTICGWLRDGKD